MLVLPAAHWAPAAILLAACTGAGALCVEIMTETGLQRMLDDEVFGRAYGLALPASIAGIAAGSLIAPVLVSSFGGTAALLACGGVVLAYCAVMWRSAREGGQAPRAAAFDRQARNSSRLPDASSSCRQARRSPSGSSRGRHRAPSGTSKRAGP